MLPQAGEYYYAIIEELCTNFDFDCFELEFQMIDRTIRSAVVLGCATCALAAPDHSSVTFSVSLPVRRLPEPTPWMREVWPGWKRRI